MRETAKERTSFLLATLEWKKNVGDQRGRAGGVEVEE
jgi:hypothetical protein